MKFITLIYVRMTNLITLDAAMHVTVLTSLKIVIKQLVSDVNLTSIVLPHLNAPGDDYPTDPITITHLTKISPGIYMKQIIVT